MNAMLSDEELTGLLAEAAAEFTVPELALPQVSRPAHRAWYQRRGWQAAAAAAVLVSGAVLASPALSGGGGTTTVERAPASPTGSTPYGAANRAGGGAAVGAVGAVGAPVGATALDQQRSLVPASGVGVAGVGRIPTAAQPQDQARVVKTGELTLAVGDAKVSATVVRLEGIVGGLGGYVSDSTSQEAGDHPSATMTVRVPVARFEALVAQVRALKVKVVSAQTSGKDVTADYADVQAQIQSLKAARNRYLAILAGTKTIGETLSVQQRVDAVQGQIDRLEGQRRVLADQSDLGTLTINVGEQVDQLAVSEPTGWSKAWKDARHGFASGLQALLAGSGRGLLVLLVGLVLLVVARFGWRLARRRLV